MATVDRLTLTESAYLLPYDVGRRRHRGLWNRVLVQAAALYELSADGLIHDDAGRPRVGDDRADDPILEDLLIRMRGWSAPPDWLDWVDHDARITRRAVEAELARRGVIRFSHERFLRVWPRSRVTVADPAIVSDLVARVRAAAFGDVPVEQVDERDGVLAAFAAAAEVGSVLSWTGRLRHRRRIARLKERTGPMASHVARSLVRYWPPVP